MPAFHSSSNETTEYTEHTEMSHKRSINAMERQTFLWIFCNKSHENQKTNLSTIQPYKASITSPAFSK